MANGWQPGATAVQSNMWGFFFFGLAFSTLPRRGSYRSSLLFVSRLKAKEAAIARQMAACGEPGGAQLPTGHSPLSGGFAYVWG